MEQLTILNVDTGDSVRCQYNPSEMSYSKSNKWEPKDSGGSHKPTVTFKGEGLQSISLSLTFDTYEGNGSVTALTDEVLGLMKPAVSEPAKNSKSKQSRPPHLQLQWGTSKSPLVVLSEVGSKFTLFKADGTPVRATLQLKFQEVPPQGGGQNPTSRAAGAQRMRMIQAGDTIDWIAAKELGDAGAWRLLAEANGIDDPRRLRPGQHLLIPAEP